MSDLVLGQSAGRKRIRPLLAALRMLSKASPRRNRHDARPEPGLHLYICPYDPAALPFGWDAFEERSDTLRRTERPGRGGK